jgi:hypothetical protein
MEVLPAFRLSREHTLEQGVIQKRGDPPLALASKGVMVTRPRSKYAKEVVNAAFKALPEEGFLSRAVVAASMVDKFFADGGAENALGRLERAYPQTGTHHLEAITAAEAAQALRECGIDMSLIPSAALRPFPLVPREDGTAGVMVNPKSENGFPTLGRWETDEGAVARMCMGYAVRLRNDLEQVSKMGPDAVVQYVHAQARANPLFFAVKGKAKADYYTAAKLTNAMMRFYNVFPRHVLLNMQVATQVLEGNARHIGVDWTLHTGVGLTLVRGGAQTLVSALDRQLEKHGYAFVHVGDDSWVALKRKVRGEPYSSVIMFALDCSNFDLTQHADGTLEVHAAIRRELARTDKVAAALWYAYARGRRVVVAHGLNRWWRHAGPSGMPLQTKVNDMLMHVMCRRTVTELARGALDESRVAQVVESVGSGMGFRVRLEQFSSTVADTLMEAVSQVPFLFIGYYFHVRDGGVRCMADVPRTFAQVPYPATKWAKTHGELMVREAMRLGSICLNLGLPTLAHEPALEAFRAQADALLSRVIRDYGDVNNPALRWAVQQNPWGADTIPSLSGLQQALRRDPKLLWLGEVLVAPRAEPSSSNWADLAEEEEASEAQAAHATVERPLPVLGVRPRRIPEGRVATHPATRANDGRPPPTAVWGPDLPPRYRELRVRVPRGRRAEWEGQLAYESDSSAQWEADDEERSSEDELRFFY